MPSAVATDDLVITSPDVTARSSQMAGLLGSLAVRAVGISVGVGAVIVSSALLLF